MKANHKKNSHIFHIGDKVTDNPEVVSTFLRVGQITYIYPRFGDEPLYGVGSDVYPAKVLQLYSEPQSIRDITDKLIYKDKTDILNLRKKIKKMQKDLKEKESKFFHKKSLGLYEKDAIKIAKKADWNKSYKE